MRQFATDKSYVRVPQTMVVLGDAVERLQVEHIELEDKLLILYGMARGIGWDEDVINWIGPLRNLKDKALLFIEKMDAHSEWEEKELFPLAELYIGEYMEQLTEMEQEHELARQYILGFIDAVNKCMMPVRRAQAKETVFLLLQANMVLVDHFKKEERIIIGLTDQSNRFNF